MKIRSNFNNSSVHCSTVLKLDHLTLNVLCIGCYGIKQYTIDYFSKIEHSAAKLLSKLRNEWATCLSQNKQDAQLSQRDRAAGCVIVFAKSRRLEMGDNILRTL